MNQPLAYVHPGAKIAKNVVIEPFAIIHNNVEIGEGSWIGSNVTIMEGARIGKNVSIFPGAVISAVPQDKKYEGEDSVTVIGDNTTIRECVTINRGTRDRMITKVGKNCWIMAYCHIAHDCIIGDNCTFSNYTGLAGHVDVGDFVTLGAMVGVHQFVTIGKHAFLGAGSMVGKDVPPYTKAAREPLSYAGVNSIGLRRRGFSTEKIREIQNIYRILFQDKKNNSQAAAIIEAEMEATSERDEILQFVRGSKRGVMKGYYE